MSKDFLGMDERNVNTALRVCTVLYLITLMALIGGMFYKQFILHQPIELFEDVAIIVTFNVIVLLGAILYFGGFTLKRMSPRQLITIYVGFVLIGFVFTMVKYTVFLGQELDFFQILNKLFIITVICGILVFVWWLFAFLGNRRIEKQIKWMESENSDGRE